MQEIEVKARLKDREAVMQKLTAMGCTFAPAVTQDDMVYVKTPGDLATFLSNEVFVRIRIVDGMKVLLTLKKPMKVNDTEHLVKLEHETVIGSAEEMRAILGLMGYSEALQIKKTRITTHYDGCEVCIDNVEGLGAFIEIEKLSKDGDATEIQKQLFEMLSTFGIDESDRVLKGYDILMFERK